MPRYTKRRKFNKTYKKKKYAKSFSPKAALAPWRSTRLYRPTNLGYLLPQRLRIKMPYYDSDNRSVSAVAIGSCNWTFSGNNCVDPLVSGPVASTGHQPMLWDTFSGLYSKCIVRGCKISAMFHANGITMPGNSFQVFLYPNNSSINIWTTLASFVAMREQDKMKFKYIPTTYEGGASKCMIKAYQSTKSMFNDNAKGRDYSIDCTAGTAPTYIWYWNMVATTEDQTTACTFYVDTKLTYYCEFYDPVPTGIS